MKRFFSAAFKITWFQIFIIVFFCTLKYILIYSKLESKVQGFYLWTLLGAGLVLLITVGIKGAIENTKGNYEHWETTIRQSKTGKALVTFLNWGMILPAALVFVLFLYLIAPTSWSMAIALYVGIVIRNTINFFEQKKTESTIEGQ
jgi:hypothetical protein